MIFKEYTIDRVLHASGETGIFIPSVARDSWPSGAGGYSMVKLFFVLSAAEYWG